MKIFYSFIATICFYFLNLYLNFSFTFLGFDLNNLGKQSDLVQEYLKFAIKPTINIICLYFILFYFVIQLLFFYKKNLKKKHLFFSFFYTLIIFFLCFSHSVVKFPQLYGDFFYNQYPTFLPYLYFLTESTKPYYWYFLLGVLVFIPVIGNFFFIQTYRNNDKIYFSLILSFFFIQQLSNLVLTSIFFYFIFIFSLKKIQDYDFYKKANTYIAILLLVTSITICFSRDIANFIRNAFLGLFPNSSKIDIVLISVDSLRADRINERAMPNLTSFLKEKNVYHFKDHHTTIARTFPSWTDLLTGKYGIEHKIRHMFPSNKNKQLINEKKIQTLPDFLNQRGYHTGVISSFAGDIFPRIDFGYKQVQTPTLNINTLITQKILQTQIFLLPVLTGSLFGGGQYIQEARGFAELGTDQYILKDTFEFLDENRYNPFFLTFFSSVVHFPYSPPYPYYKKFTDKNYYGKYKYHKFIDTSSEEELSEIDKKQIINLYDGAVYAFDNAFGKILKKLKKMNSYENMLLIITSDHGEALFESDHLQGHGDHLQGENITKIPLVMKLPKSFAQNKNFSQKNVHDVTSTLDIFPTIVEIINAPLHENLEGLSLIFNLKKLAPVNKTAYSETGIWFVESSKAFYQQDRILYPSIFKMQNMKNGEIQIDNPSYEETISIAKHRMILNKDFKLIYIPTKNKALYKCYDRKKDSLNENPIDLKFCRPLLQELKKLLIEKENMIEIDGYFLPKSVL